jgi:hypothetical protein
VGVALSQTSKDGKATETDGHDVAKVGVVLVRPGRLDDVNPRKVVGVGEVA